MTDATKQDALRLFEELQAELPHLVMHINPNNTDVEVSVDVPQQPGLAFDIHLNLQNGDERHLEVGAFWCSWFPSSDPEVVRKYHDAVTGVLTRRNRIVEYVRWGRTAGADLEAPDSDGWKTIAKSRQGLFPVSWGATRRVVRNTGGV